MYYLNLIIMDMFDRSVYGQFTHRVTEVKSTKTPGKWEIFCDIVPEDTGWTFVISETETNKVIPKVGDIITVIHRDNNIQQIRLNGKILWSADGSCQTKKFVCY